MFLDSLTTFELMKFAENLLTKHSWGMRRKKLTSVGILGCCWCFCVIHLFIHLFIFWGVRFGCRASGKHARGAYNAYMAGDHTHAKQFSREARENFKNAEKLHAQAAEEILYSRNAGQWHSTCLLYHDTVETLYSDSDFSKILWSVYKEFYG